MNRPRDFFFHLEAAVGCSCIFAVFCTFAWTPFPSKDPPHYPGVNYNEAVPRFMWRYPGVLLVLSVFLKASDNSINFFCPRLGRKSRRSRQAGHLELGVPQSPQVARDDGLALRAISRDNNARF